MTPFWNGGNTFWKSASEAVKDWTKFNYEYPEFVKLKGLGVSERRQAILQTVNSLYGPKLSTGPMHQIKAAAANVQAALSSDSGPSASLEKADMVDWFIRVRSGRFALGQSYTILLFLGEPPAEESEWRTSPNLLGIHSIFASSRASMCANCESQRDNVDEGIVHITARLEKLGLLSKPEEEIEKYVRANLHWRIQKVSFQSATIIDGIWAECVRVLD